VFGHQIATDWWSCLRIVYYRTGRDRHNSEIVSSSKLVEATARDCVPETVVDQSGPVQSAADILAVSAPRGLATAVEGVLPTTDVRKLCKTEMYSDDNRLVVVLVAARAGCLT
jgi:hypothetical protein